MIQVWKSPHDNRVYIYNVTEGPADSFVAIRTGDRIAIARRWIGIVEIANVSFHEIMDSEGNTFDTPEATLEYLNQCFTASITELASALEKDFVCAEDISALKFVFVSTDLEEISVANPAFYESSLTLGMTTYPGALGQKIPVRLFGKLDDSSFQFPINAPLFLDRFGRPTDVAPPLDGSSTLTRVGHSLGAGSIFIKPEKPVIIQPTGGI